MDKQEALAISFANLKGAKSKDLLQTARALQYLKSLPEHRSNAQVAAAVGVSAEIVREFLALLKLPEDIQELFGQNLLKLEHGRRLWQLSRRRPGILGEAAAAMCDMTAMDARHFVEYLLQYPEVPVQEVKRTIIESKTIIEREYHVVALLPEDEYKLLAQRARTRGVSLDRLVSSIVKQWLDANGSP